MVAGDEPREHLGAPFDATVSRRSVLKFGVFGAAAGIASSLFLADPSVRATGATPNPVVVENERPGTDQWRITLNRSDDSARQICGFASATSVNVGDRISLFVSVNPAQPFELDVYRLGYYGGLGGRLMLHDSVQGTRQPDPVVDRATGMVSCPWLATYLLTIPADWTTGIYLVKLTNSAQFQSYLTFVVRDDSSTSALLYQQSVTTYQAYNNFPNDVPSGASVPATGKSLYEYNSSTATTSVGTTRAVKVSFDRPYSGDNGAGQFLDWELCFVRWLEQCGYDVSYCTDLDTHTDADRITRHRGFLSVGHDEYWSAAMYDGVSRALDSGVGLGFFGGNAIYWQIRFEANGAGTPNRVQVCYKDAAADPVSGAASTVQWRSSPVNRPEQRLLGSMFIAQQQQGAAPVPFVVTNSSNWVYEGTGVADGDSIPGIVGYECDQPQSGYPLPVATAGTYTLLSDSPFPSAVRAPDGSGRGTLQHCSAVVYQATSGAWVFNAGTVDWSRGLSNIGGSTAADARIQKMTANILDALAAGPARATGPGRPMRSARSAPSTRSTPAARSTPAPRSPAPVQRAGGARRSPRHRPPRTAAATTAPPPSPIPPALIGRADLR